MKKYFSRDIGKNSYKLFFLLILLKSTKELSNARDNTTLNTWVLQIYVSRNNLDRKMLELL